LSAIHASTPIRRPRHRPLCQWNHWLFIQPQSRPQAAERPILRPRDQLRPQRVSLDVSAKREKMPVTLARKRLKPPLINMPAAHTAAVFDPPASVRDRQPLHELRKLSVAPRGEHQVPMIRHDTIRQHRHRRLIQNVPKTAEKGDIILLMPKQIHPPDPAVKDVVNQPTGRFASLAWHDNNCKLLIDRGQGKSDLSRFRFFSPALMSAVERATIPNTIPCVETPADARRLAPHGFVIHPAVQQHQS